ncbi:hypothetical protein F5B18DRAFT_166233 [Nemania serpens]|nr:hypothetical protein F5B18DRAFT_166233 [Nemania serpens]
MRLRGKIRGVGSLLIVALKQMAWDMGGVLRSLASLYLPSSTGSCQHLGATGILSGAKPHCNKEDNAVSTYFDTRLPNRDWVIQHTLADLRPMIQ